MLAALCYRFGPPEDIRIEDVATPIAGAGEALVKIHAAGVNFADVLMVAGTYQVKPPLPFTPGLEFAGVVADIGPGVNGLSVGDRVMGAPMQGGSFAEYIRMPADRLFRLPAEVSFELASGFLVGHGTAGFSLQYRARMQRGETVLITGAGGGVGVAAVGVAKRMGAFVIAAAGSDDKLAIATAHGADATVNYTTEDMRERIKAITAGRGVNVVLDMVGGAPFESALRSTAPWARVVTVGFASGDLPRIRAEYLLIKNLTVLGSGFGGAIANYPSIARETIDELFALHKAEPFRAEIGGESGLGGVPAALRRIANRDVIGKLVIKPQLTVR
jgi:NADPH2:quinone reductase